MKVVCLIVSLTFLLSGTAFAQSDRSPYAAKSVSTPPKIIPYEGFLEAGKIYQARAVSDERNNLSLAVPLKILPHHAVLIEWINQAKFPWMKERQIVFRVVAEKTTRVESNRWNTIYSCKILKVER